MYCISYGDFVWKKILTLSKQEEEKLAPNDLRILLTAICLQNNVNNSTHVDVSKSCDVSFSRQDKVYIHFTGVSIVNTFRRVSTILGRRQQLIISNYDSVWSDRNTTVANGPLLNVFNSLRVSVTGLLINELCVFESKQTSTLMLLIHETFLSNFFGTIRLTIGNSLLLQCKLMSSGIWITVFGKV